MTLLRDQLNSEFIEQFGQSDFDTQLRLVGGRYDFRQVESELDVVPNGVYLLRSEQEGLLVSIASCEWGEPVELVNLVSGGEFQVPMELWLQFGSQRKIVLLQSDIGDYVQPKDQSGNLQSSDSAETDSAAGDTASGDTASGDTASGDTALVSR